MINSQIIVLLLFLKYNLCILHLIRRIEELQRERIRRWGVKPFNSPDNRRNFGAFTTIYSYFKNNDHEEFYDYTRMNVPTFTYLSDLVLPKLEKRSRREPLNPELRLIAVINCLAHGAPVAEQAWSYRIGRCTMYQLIPEVCRAIYETLAPKYMPFPQKEDWKEIARQIYLKWNLPNCMGPLDGKHIEINSPDNSGSAFFNFKNYFSTVVLATCDAYLRFTWTNVGGYGASNDAFLFRNSDLYQLLENNKDLFPEPDYLPGTNIKFPYYIIGDSAFPLKEYLMTPYSRNKKLTMPQRVYNYRISRCRRLIESAFGLLVKKWRIFEGPMDFDLETVENIVLAPMCLHNFIITMEMDLPYEDQHYKKDAHNFILSRKKEEDKSLPEITPIAMRSILQQYFVSPAGSIPWQYKKI